MFTRNRHLNVFEHYQSVDTLPIENNVSRGFAIILESYPLVLDRFIDYVNRKCAENGIIIHIPKPDKTEQIDVGFQQSVKQIAGSYSELSTVVGITLTTADDLAIGIDGIDANNALITDISIVVGDAVVVIEVKRNAINAQQQLSQQITSLIKELSPEDDNNKIRNTTLPGTWEDILGILQNSRSLLRENENGILAQYLAHLELRYQSWFPVKRFSEMTISEDNASFIDKRISILARNCCDNPDDAKQQWGGFTIPTGKPYAGGVLIEANYNTKALEVKIWVADTKGQGRVYFTEVVKDLQWIYDTQIGIGAQSYPMSVHPYFRFAHFQSTIFIELLKPDYRDANLETDVEKWKEIWRKVSREWKQNEWSDLKYMFNTDYDGIIDCDRFFGDFDTYFEKSNRTYVHVSLGFWVTITIPHDVVCKKENEGALSGIKKKDALAELVKMIVTKTMNRIE